MLPHLDLLVRHADAVDGPHNVSAVQIDRREIPHMFDTKNVTLQCNDVRVAVRSGRRSNVSSRYGRGAGWR